MQTVKGLIALFLVAAAVFAAVVLYNNRTEPAYEAKMIKAKLAETIKPARQTAKATHATGQQIQKSNL
jgi:hypothetical protein